MANGCSVDVSKMQPVDFIVGEDKKETALLKEMGIEARDFLSSHEWCDRLGSLHLGFGIGGVVAVFLAQISSEVEDLDSCLWVIVGDIPPAYIAVDENPTAAGALDAYCAEMEAWVEAVNAGASVDELIPVNVPPTREWARQLGGRLQFVRSKILPRAQAGN